jgi:hypothetical protein
MPHEHIVANATCYLSSSESLKGNHLQFRSLLTEDPFDDTHELLGQVDTPNRRILVWKNDILHKVGPLSSLTPEEQKQEKEQQEQEQDGRVKKVRKRNNASDTSRARAGVEDSSPLQVPPSGVRKILSFFLVSPVSRVVSTKAFIPLEVAEAQSEEY